MKPCPACPDGNEWHANSPTGMACPVCKGFAVVSNSGADMSYDVKCFELAQAFLSDFDVPTPEGHQQASDELAQAIQDAVEGWRSTSGLREKA